MRELYPKPYVPDLYIFSDYIGWHDGEYQIHHTF
ncbi:conserved hypothetical protein [Xenorhabdus nematophila F1]|uniref:Uncharacterized protein n=1 Tax=Xenorhabdus nematophila (strain ATCC 19061 / DSM 3370 / CCUG 14189 / LMG 1036 / NCIMB 9965 / AN6) TaxID=406817 RepID=D3VFJ1_XENNA|nr:hypothetical protein XNC1_2246 [Xenorhabdus nematophila ATCC 19061]CCW32315.1 conserved hypothetical protein [Xenorhabdus nematophila F1]